ncbi:MAG: cellulase family glycosylhydrolase [Ignavibacteria bacterium]|nr:cellulase family glycosylhydrolase [Ignavibacteria bacterium]
MQNFFGCNMYELAFVDDETSELMLRDAAKAGFETVRFWCFYGVQDSKLQFIISSAKKYNLKLIPVLADRWGYNQSFIIDSEWYKENYKKEYLPFVLNLTGKFKNSEEILLWELINEPASEKFEYIYNFVKDTAKKIKKVNSRHAISLGTIGGIGDKFGSHFSRFNSSLFEKLYSIDELDAISIHDYSYDAALLDRIEIHYYFSGKEKQAKMFKALNSPVAAIRNLWDRFCIKIFGKIFSNPVSVRWLWGYYIRKNIASAKKLGKPVYIGEIGYKAGSGKFRKDLIEYDRKRYSKAGVSGYMLWSFEAQGKSKDGHGYGFSENFLS